MNTDKKRKKSNISVKRYLSNAFLVLLTVLVTGCVSLYFAISIKQQDMDTTIMNVSTMVSQLDIVKEGLKNGSLEEASKKELDLLIDSFEQIDVLVVCDTESIRLYHNSEERVGQHFVGDDQDRILNGSESYISVAEGTLGMQRRAFCAVTDEKDTIIGFVVASVLTVSLEQIRNQIIYTFLFLLAALSVFGFLLSAVSMYWLRNIFLGYQPEEFKNMYIERTEVMDALEEGIFAINTSGNVILMNRAAKKMLDLSPSDAT